MLWTRVRFSPAPTKKPGDHIMLRLSCGEYEQMEFNSIKRSIYTTTDLLTNQISRLRSKHTLYLTNLQNFLSGEEHGLHEEEM